MNLRLKTILAGLALFLASCSGEAVQKPKHLSGEYTGTFMRTSPLANYPTRDVSMTFAGPNFSGTGDDPQYPGICNGTFNIQGYEIEFTNACFWTANFDWTLILSGKYEYSVSGDSVTLIKRMGDISDSYHLVRK